MALIPAASGGERNVLEFWYLRKFRKVKRSLHRDKREYIIALVRETEDTANNYDFAAVHRIAKELAPGSNSPAVPVKGVNGKLLIHNDG